MPLNEAYFNHWCWVNVGATEQVFEIPESSAWMPITINIGTGGAVSVSLGKLSGTTPPDYTWIDASSLPKKGSTNLIVIDFPIAALKVKNCEVLLP
jgi:hypothetical protein